MLKRAVQLPCLLRKALKCEVERLQTVEEISANPKHRTREKTEPKPLIWAAQSHSQLLCGRLIVPSPSVFVGMTVIVGKTKLCRTDKAEIRLGKEPIDDRLYRCIRP